MTEKEALLLAVEEVDNCWVDDGDMVIWNSDELPERLIALRAAYKAYEDRSALASQAAPVATLHTCWDNHEGPDGTHADGSRCRDKATPLYAAVPPEGRLTGRDVHREWRDGMLAQGREVAPERMAWETLDQCDRDLDDRIAARLAAVPPEGLREAFLAGVRRGASDGMEGYPMVAATNGWCRFCPTFNGGWLAWQAFEKAEREGRNHGDHFHRTLEARAACARLSSSVVTVNDDGTTDVAEAS